MAINKFNIIYPSIFGADNKLLTSNNSSLKNKSRINMILDFRPNNRPYHPIYGTILGNLEQESGNSPLIVESILDLRTVLNKYTKDYLTVNSIGAEKSDQRTLRTIVDYNSK